MLKHKNITMILAFVVAISLLMTACTEKSNTEQSNSEKQEIKELVFAESFEWEAMDTYQIEWEGIAQTAHAEGILTYSINDKSLVPNTAIAYEFMEEGKLIKLTIPEGLKYGNGVTVSPEDVKRSIEWGLEVSPYNWDYMIIENITVEGQDVIIKCEDYSSTLEYYLTSLYLPILSKEQIDQSTSEDLLLKAVQYGLFYIDEYVSGSHVKLKKNEYYQTSNPNVENKGPSHVDTLIVKFMPDGFSRVAGLKAGEIDISSDIPIENIEELEADPNIELFKYPVAGMVYMTLNMDNSLFEDINVRKAIAYTIDREMIVNANKGYVNPTYSFIVPEMLDYTEDMGKYYQENYSNNTERAKQLLSEAGWLDNDGDGYLEKDGNIFEFSLLSSTESPHSKNTIQAMQIGFKDIGIKLNVGTAENGYLKEKLSTDDYDAILLHYIWADPVSILPYIIFDTNNLNDESYYDLLTEAARNINKEDRIQKLNEAQKILMDEVGFIPLLQEYNTIAYRKNITGIKYLFDHRMIFNDVDKK